MDDSASGNAADDDGNGTLGAGAEDEAELATRIADSVLALLALDSD